MAEDRPPSVGRLFETRALQAAILVGGLVPVSAGLVGIVAGGALTGDRMGPPGDSHVRYLSGLLLGIGLLSWSCVLSIERRSARFGLLTAIVVTGGAGRLAGLLLAGSPGAPMLAALAMELIVTPALCLWQRRVARLAGMTEGPGSG